MSIADNQEGIDWTYIIEKLSDLDLVVVGWIVGDVERRHGTRPDLDSVVVNDLAIACLGCQDVFMSLELYCRCCGHVVLLGEYVDTQDLAAL